MGNLLILHVKNAMFSFSNNGIGSGSCESIRRLILASSIQRLL